MKPTIAFFLTTITLYVFGTLVDSKFFRFHLNFDSAGNFFTEITFLPIIIGALVATIVKNKTKVTS
ncbi:hypothetical protein GCM10007425_28840 [Lysinibacillus alkalisoli]|uniref:Uncharacterized protein n=1 Tax=Lysinibacillus alkalisoli TaxID=1911548 RepID=A0A917GAB0_9BACI|nr:hypothetical protein GCM10007425_28840 [Lysinibacillus alkalisoli]